MVIETHALWGDEPTEEHPATYTAYLAEPVPARANKPRPAVVICGGGSFTSIAAHEQEPVAFEFLNRGFQAFTLDYVTSATGDVSFPNPEVDLAKMVATVRVNAKDWHVDPERVVVVGFSAGGFVCASLAAQWKSASFAALAGERLEYTRPDAAILAYPVLDFRVVRDEQTRDPRIDLRVPKTGGKTGRDLLNDYFALVMGGDATDERMAEVCPTTHVSRDMPPTFVWGTADDRTCPIAQVYDFASAMARESVAHEVHVFDRGGHGLSVANVNTRSDNEAEQRAVDAWVDLAFDFLVRQGIVEA